MLIKPFCSIESTATASYSWRRRQVLRAGASSLILGLLAPRLAYATSVLGVRVWPARDYTRVTIESDQPLDYQQQVLQDPERVVIDLNGLELDQPLRDLVAKITPNDPHIQQVRVGQFQPNVVRLVIDLKGAVKPQSFAVPPAGSYRYRLVFDLYPAVPTDPLLELLAQTERKERVLQEAQSLPAPVTPTPANPPAAAPGAQTALNDNSDAFFQQFAQNQASASGATVPPLANAAPPAIPRPGAQRGVPSAPSNSPSTLADSGGTNSNGAFKAPARNGFRQVRLLTIAIDPGHGGEDPGAIGSAGTYEKHIALDVGRRLRKKIDAQANMRSIMTRDDDFFVPLNVRVQKARRVGADLFVSVHADAFTTPSARGSSVFALSENGASSAAARWMANKENASDLIGGVNFKTEDVALSRALLDMSTTAQIKDSLKYGTFVLDEIGDINKLHHGSVEQAGFAVLKAPDIPSVLVETAFISNPEEEAKLNNPDYRDQMADAILRGIKKYFAANPPMSKNPLV